MSFFKKHKSVLLFLLLAVTFFTARLTITWDSAHYLSYVEIFEKVRPFSSWDIVRGPVFPLIIFLGNVLFGKNAIGMLCLIFMFYLAYCLLIYSISKVLFDKFKHRNIYSTIFIFFCVFNPLIFGYYHTLLTEFVAITLMVLSCFISWKWLYTKRKRDMVFYSLFHIVLLSFCYFLKQPFMCIAFVPLFISCIISIIDNHKLKNILYRSGTFVSSLIFLFIGIVCWNHILVSRGVDMNTGRDSATLLSGQLLGAISNFDMTIIDDYSVIENDSSLSKSERASAKKIFDKNYKIMLIKIYEHDKLIESDYIPVKDGGSSVVDVAKELTFFSIKHPDLMIKSYSKNYCAISSICIIGTNDSVNYWITNSLDFFTLYENNSIAYKFLNSGSNLFYLSPEKYQSAVFYEQVGGLSVTSKIISLFKMPTNIAYKLVMVLMPLTLVLFSVICFIRRKVLKRNKLCYFGLIFLVSSFFTTIISSASGQIIDRYSVYCFIPGLVGIIACVRYCLSNISFRKEKK